MPIKSCVEWNKRDEVLTIVILGELPCYACHAQNFVPLKGQKLYECNDCQYGAAITFESLEAN